MSRLLSSFIELLQKRNVAAFCLKKKKSATELSFGSLTHHPKWHLVAHQTLSGSEIVLGRTYVNPRSDESVNVNAATELGAR